MPILGVVASSKLIAPSGDWDFIASVSPTSSGQATIQFTSIPQDYKHLYLTWTVIGVSNGDINFAPASSSAQNNQFFNQGSVGAFYNSNIYLGAINYALNVGSAFPHFGYGFITNYTGGNNQKNFLSWNTAINASNSETNNMMTRYTNDANITGLVMTCTGGGFGTATKLNLYGIKN
jgi:hypothetical protein